jgi:PAS domain S-box-containing protein
MREAVRSYLGARPRPRILRYGVTIVSVGAALLLTVVLYNAGLRGPLFIPAVLLSAWFGGVGPGLLAAVLATFCLQFFLTEPRYTLQFVSVADAAYLAAFAMSAGLVAWVTGRQRTAEVALRTAHADLTARMQDLAVFNERLETEIVERRRAEAEIVEQASLLDLTHDSIFVRDVDDIISYWNRGAELQYGWSRAEAVGRVSHQLMHTVFPAPLPEIEAELSRTGRWEGELIHTKRDGTQLVVASRWSVQRDEQGRPTHVLETNNDVSERTRAEEELRRSEAYLAEAQRLSHTGSWAHSMPSGDVIYWSDETYRIVGLDPRTGPPSPEVSQQLIHPDERAQRREVLDRAIRERMDFEIAGRIVRPDGTIRHTVGVGHPVLNASGDVVEFVGSIIDVTDRTRAEEELRESEKRYRHIFQTVGVSIWQEDFSRLKAAIEELKSRGIRDFREYLATHPEFVQQAISMVKVVDVNDATVKLFGAESKDDLLVSLHKVFLPETEDVFAAELIAIAEDQRSFEAETVLQTLNGARLTVLFTMAFPPTTGRFESVLVTLTDVTERMRAAAALQQAQAELARVTRVTMLGEITASIAHEVNQPLAAVVMNGNACRRWLDADPPDLDEARDAARRVVDSGNRASEVVRRIRSLLKRQAPEKAPLDVNAIIQDTLALTQAELARRQVLVRTELAEALPSTMGDRVALEQVLVNLVLNGADAMADETALPRQLTIRSRADDMASVVVEVRDSGKGLDPGYADRIFKPFFSTKPEGLGMGLAISRSIVEAHGGKIWAAPNDAGPGATLGFMIPTARGEAPQDTTRAGPRHWSIDGLERRS